MMNSETEIEQRLDEIGERSRNARLDLKASFTVLKSRPPSSMFDFL